MQYQITITTMNGQRVNLQAFRNWTDPEGIKGIDLTNSIYWPKYGVAEQQVTVDRPDDYSDETYYRTEQWDAPYVIYTKKPDWQVAEAANNKVQAQIDTLERESLMARGVREVMIALMEKEATAAGFSKEQLYAANIGYKKLVDLHKTINDLRAKFVPVVGKPVAETPAA